MAGEYGGPDRRVREPGSIGRRHSDRKGPRHARDFWLFVITALVALALLNNHATTSQVARNQRSDTQALCSFRDDLQKRADSTQMFMRSHPQGIPGIPAATLQITLTNERHTLRALSPLVC